MTESITTVLQKINLKTNFISTGREANSTELSKHFWEIKRKSIEKTIMHWSVEDHAKPYQNESKRCNLRLTEKYYI